jgi:streptogramin lyase
MSIKLKLGNTEVEGQVVAFKPVSEPWSEYLLPDGSVLHYRATVTRLIKTSNKNDDGTDQYIAQGQPQFTVDEAPTKPTVN